MFINTQTITFTTMNKNIIFSIISLLFLAFAYYQEAIIPQRESAFYKGVIEEVYHKNKFNPHILENGLGRIEYCAIIPNRTLEIVLTIEDETKIGSIAKELKSEINSPSPFTKIFDSKILELMAENDFNLLFTLKNKEYKFIQEVRVTKDGAE